MQENKMQKREQKVKLRNLLNITRFFKETLPLRPPIWFLSFLLQSVLIFFFKLSIFQTFFKLSNYGIK